MLLFITDDGVVEITIWLIDDCRDNKQYQYQLFLFINLYIQFTYCLSFIRITLNCVYFYLNGCQIITIINEIINILNKYAFNKKEISINLERKYVIVIQGILKLYST